MQEERRSAPRVVVETPVWVGHRGIFLRTKVLNLSLSGALIEGVSETFDVGTVVTIRCALRPDEPEIVGEATVRGHRPGGLIAVEFQAWPEDDHQRLSSFVEQRL